MQRFAIALMCVVAHILASCSLGTGKSNSENDSIDSCVVELPPVVEPLPDTVFASIDKLEYKIDLFGEDSLGCVDELGDAYADVPGILTFRGGPLRDARYNGRVTGRPDTVVVDWVYETDSRGVWGGGTGWTGQPLYIHWLDTCAAIAKGATEEVMFGSLCGRVYFVDFNSGKATREPIDVSNPIKGTMMLDPTLNGHLYVGQGVPNSQPFGALTIDLRSHDIAHTYPMDSRAWRHWGAYDSSPVRVGQFVFRPGENGTLYKYRVVGNDEQLHSTLRFRRKGLGGAGGMEASMSVYANYGYVADNHGNVVCVNLNNLQPVWHYDNKDDNDASPVIGVEDGVPYVYCSCEVDRQGLSGIAHFAKLNGLTGEEVWQYTEPANKALTNGKHFDGGFYGTPLIGEGDCADLVFANLVLNTKGQNGNFIALDRATGRLVYSIPLGHYAWSSPVSLINDAGEMFVFTADTYGSVYLIHGRTGDVLFKQRIGANFESSPIVVDNHIILGSRGNQVFRMTVK